MSRRPRLHLADLADDNRVHAAIDGLFVESAEYAKHTRKILATQSTGPHARRGLVWRGRPIVRRPTAIC